MELSPEGITQWPAVADEASMKTRPLSRTDTRRVYLGSGGRWFSLFLGHAQD